MANRETPTTSRNTFEAAAGRVVGRLVRRARKPAGAVPGTLVHTGPKKVDETRLRFLDYTETDLREEQVDRIEACFPFAAAPTVTWVNVDGLHETDIIESIGERFGLHRLLLEDIVSTGQRPKVEEYGQHVFIVVKMLSFNEATEEVRAEQVSFVVGENYVFSFQERFGDVFEPVRVRLRESRGRIRSRGPDYLTYALLDAIVDSYFQILEQVGDHIEELEEAVLDEPDLQVMHRIHHLKREMLVLRRAVWPLREVLGSLYRGETPLMTEESQVFIRDVQDHAIQVIDTVETLREVLSGAMDLYLSSVSNRMNEVMKVLTIIATIFIPLSFFAGLYGMNFEYMPELGVRWAYPALLLGMTTVAAGMLWFFRRRDWL